MEKSDASVAPQRERFLLPNYSKGCKDGLALAVRGKMCPKPYEAFCGHQLASNVKQWLKSQIVIAGMSSFDTYRQSGAKIQAFHGLFLRENFLANSVVDQYHPALLDTLVSSCEGINK
jgi:hypothetical protein